MAREAVDRTRKVLILLIFLAYDAVFCSGYGYNPFRTVVQTSSGTVRGKHMKVAGTDLTAFLGVPYAEPPVGEHRFKKAVPKRSWTGVYEATEISQPCMQYTTKDLPWMTQATPSEDCLYLNVWVPDRRNFFELEPTGKPVLLWIHGGGYFSGSSELSVYDGAVLATQGNVIVVSLNYRLGVFGFLTFGTDGAPGNMGMHDQYLAIRWVRNNIKEFGGDPDRITLFGQSAGAVSVALHLISPLTRNFVRRVIMQSGSPYHPVLIDNRSSMILLSNGFATAVGCSSNATSTVTRQRRVLECLRRKDPMQLAILESQMLGTSPFAFLPTHGDDFMPLSPVSAIVKGDFKQTEVLIGSNRDEGSIFLHYIRPDIFTPQTAPNVSVDLAKLLIAGLFQNSTNPSPEVIADYYLKDASDDNPAMNLRSAYQSFENFVFDCPELFFAEKVAKTKDVFFYYFTHRPCNSPWGEWMGVIHFEEVPFVFGVPIRKTATYTSEEKYFSADMMQKWAAFAKSGVPTGSGGKEFPKFKPDNPLCLELNPRSHRVFKVPSRKACEFWRPYFHPKEL